MNEELLRLVSLLPARSYESAPRWNEWDGQTVLLPITYDTSSPEYKEIESQWERATLGKEGP